jgi:hypothetical protein
MKRAIASLVLLLASGGAGYAQTIADIDKRDAAVTEAWAATPLTVRRALFVTGHPDGFGQYVERPNNAFKKGEKLGYLCRAGRLWLEGCRRRHVRIRL